MTPWPQLVDDWSGTATIIEPGAVAYVGENEEVVRVDWPRFCKACGRCLLPPPPPLPPRVSVDRVRR